MPCGAMAINKIFFRRYRFFKLQQPLCCSNGLWSISSQETFEEIASHTSTSQELFSYLAKVRPTLMLHFYDSHNDSLMLLCNPIKWHIKKVCL